MAGRIRFWGWNHHDDATLSVSAAAVTGMEIQNTQNTLRGDLWRTTSNAAQSFSGTLAASRSASAFGFFRQTCGGGSVRLQLFSDAAWVTQVYDSGALAVNCFTNSDPDWFGIGTNDPYILDAPYRLYFTPTTFRSYTVSFSGTPTATAYWQICRVWLALAAELRVNPEVGAIVDWEDMTDSHRTRGGSQRTNQGETYRTGTWDLNGLYPSERGLMVDLARRLGLSRDFVLDMMPLDTTRQGRDYLFDAKFVKIGPLATLTNRLTKRLQFQEQ